MFSFPVHADHAVHVHFQGHPKKDVRDQSRRAEGDWEIVSRCQHENDHVFAR